VKATLAAVAVLLSSDLIVAICDAEAGRLTWDAWMNKT
jgi:hypothetical protein